MGIEVAAIAAIATLASASMNASAQKKASRRQEQAQQAALEEQERANTQNEMAANRENARNVNSALAAAAQSQMYKNFGQLTGGTGISSSGLPLGRGSTLSRASNVGLQAPGSLGTSARLSDDII